MTRAALLSLCLGWVAFAASGREMAMGITRIPMSSLSARDQANIDIDFVYLQMAWTWAQIPDISKYQVTEAKATFLNVEFRGVRRRLDVVELRHPDENQKKRQLVVMVSGLFASEWQDLRRAKWFYDRGYDVLKIPTAFSESYLKAFPYIEPGDLSIEAQILAESVKAYRVKYGLEVQGSDVIAFGTSYGASVVLKAAEQNPHQVFSRVIALSPVYDFSQAMQVFDRVMESSANDTEVDPARATQFLMSRDPQVMAFNSSFEPFSRNEIVKALLKKMRLYCVVRYEKDDANRLQCDQINSFRKLLDHMKIKPLTGKLLSSNDKRVYVLTTENDPFNADVNGTKSILVAIGHTVMLPKGGHFGFVSSDFEQNFIQEAL